MSQMEDFYVDPVDIAARETDRQTAAALKAQQERAKHKLPHTGKCWFCQETVKKDLIFCKPSKDDLKDGYSCRDEYDRVKAAKVRNGK